MNVNFSGIWNADLSKSIFLGLSPKAVWVRIEHSDPELLQEIVATKIDGSQEKHIFKCWTNGEQKSLLNGSAVRGCARWDGAELVIESWIQFGAREMHFCDCWSLSPDAQTLSMAHRNDDLAGQLTVFERGG